MSTNLVRIVDGATFQSMVVAALTWLQTNRQTVNKLNVFPIPDGDTGTNMVLTMQAACDKVSASNETSVGMVAGAIADGAWLGSRGNSGVILSQILRGLAGGLDGMDCFGTSDFAAAMRQASDSAYLGVGEPVEGTILTVIKDAADAAGMISSQSEDIVECIKNVVEACERSVERTPTLLPILEQTGVVDAGGLGLKFVFEGMLRYFTGDPLDVAPENKFKDLDIESIGRALETAEPGQDWEVVVDFRPVTELDLDLFYDRMKMVGTSIQLGQSEDLSRVHIHVSAAKRFEPIELIDKLGTVVNVRMENLLDQMAQQSVESEIPSVDMHPGQLVAVVVSPGSGFTRIFSGEAVSVVSGGQSMNPSVQEILQAFEDLPTDHVIILPNNTNIHPAAEQAAKTSDKQVLVLPAGAVPHGIIAMMSFNPDGDLYKVYEAMNSQIREVESGEVTTAIRAADMNGFTVQEGQALGFHNGSLVCASDSTEKCVIDLFGAMHAEDQELFTLYYGYGVVETAAKEMAEKVQHSYPEIEVEVYDGGQRNYSYIVSAE